MKFINCSIFSIAAASTKLESLAISQEQIDVVNQLRAKIEAGDLDGLDKVGKLDQNEKD